MTDEYTALQKYISTYRDPNAIKAEGFADEAEKKKNKKVPAWKVCCPPSARITRLHPH